MHTLGLKAQHMHSIFSILIAIFLLSNLQFSNGDVYTVSTYICKHLGPLVCLLEVSSELTQIDKQDKLHMERAVYMHSLL